MRVLHVVQDLSTRTGGPPTVITDVSLALERRGVGITIVATDAALMASAASRERLSPEDLPAGTDRLDVRLCPLQTPRRFAFSLPLQRLVNEIVPKYDLVHIHMLYLFPHLAAYRAARRHDIPYIVSPHSALDPYLRRRGRLRKGVAWRLWQGEQLRRAAMLHFSAKEEVALAEDIAPAVPRAVAPNGVRWSAYQTLPSGQAFRDSHLGGFRGPLVTFLGRITEKKGLDVLIDAFARAVRKAPDARLVIAGPDNEGTGPVLRQRVRAQNIEHRTAFVGMLRGEEKLAALAATDIWVLSSRSEGFPMAVVEALATGRACLLSPAVFLAAEAESEGAAVVCPPESESLAQTILELLRDRNRRQRLGDAAREFAKRYDWDLVSAEWEAMYRRAIRAPSDDLTSG
jgi:glycosyltransferase involved in cell wall biosynthesis